MNEVDFKKKWASEKKIYESWGAYVQSEINNAIQDRGIDIDIFLKIPAKYRIKGEESLLDKAFYRSDKNYSDPYNEIEDKVGIRYVVLLLDDIEIISNIIRTNENWKFDPCKHFRTEMERNPLLFTYQSVHYILRPKTDIIFQNTKIPFQTPCEVQIRTLLQHAHAELTHDAIYKTKKSIQPNVQRTVAKSMALIETTDGFFTEVTHNLNYGPLEEHCILEKLDSLYLSFTGLKSNSQKSTIAIWDAFEQFIDENLIEDIQNSILRRYPFLSDIIKREYGINIFYQQSTVLFIYWLLETKMNQLRNEWPLHKNLLDPLASDIGVSV